MFRLHFAVPGFSKCGTTTLCELLGQHPKIFIPACKEPGYFAHSQHLGWDWYLSLFPAGDNRLMGDGSTMYSVAQYAEVACERLLARFPDLRFIFIARNPVERLESSFREMHHHGGRFGIDADFDIGRTLKQCPNMVADSRYWQLIQVYRRAVSDERILVLFLEEFKENPGRELRKCFQFLNVDPNVTIGDIHRKANPAAGKMHDSRLYRYIRTHAWAQQLWSALPLSRQKYLANRLQFRRPFTAPIRWRRESLARLKEELYDDSAAFLQFYGRPAELWNWHVGAVGATLKAA